MKDKKSFSKIIAVIKAMYNAIKNFLKMMISRLKDMLTGETMVTEASFSIPRALEDPSDTIDKIDKILMKNFNDDIDIVNSLQDIRNIKYDNDGKFYSDGSKIESSTLKCVIRSLQRYESLLDKISKEVDSYEKMIDPLLRDLEKNRDAIKKLSHDISVRKQVMQTIKDIIYFTKTNIISKIKFKNKSKEDTNPEEYFKSKNECVAELLIEAAELLDESAGRNSQAKRYLEEKHVKDNSNAEYDLAQINSINSRKDLGSYWLKSLKNKIQNSYHMDLDNNIDELKKMRNESRELGRYGYQDYTKDALDLSKHNNLSNRSKHINAVVNLNGKKSNNPHEKRKHVTNECIAKLLIEAAELLSEEPILCE